MQQFFLGGHERQKCFVLSDVVGWKYCKCKASEMSFCKEKQRKVNLLHLYNKRTTTMYLPMPNIYIWFVHYME